MVLDGSKDEIDGRSITLTDMIRWHGGEAQAARDASAALKTNDANNVLAFLNSLLLFAPVDTASISILRTQHKTEPPQFGPRRHQTDRALRRFGGSRVGRRQ
jgi:hypothetical protein